MKIFNIQFRLTLLLLGFTFIAKAQFLDPVDWTMRSEKVGGHEYHLIFEATMEDGWNIYSQYLESDDGPIPTSFNYEEGGHFELMGKNEESGNKKEGFDEIFEMNVIKYSKKATFIQRVKILDYTLPITGYLEYMTCDDESCLPPTEEAFEFKFEAPAKEKKEDKKEENQNIFEASESNTLNNSLPEEQNSGFLDPVKWDITAAEEEGIILVEFKATLDEGWAIYSQFTEEGGPLPTEFFFDEGDQYERVGSVEEKGKKKEGPDPLFDVTVIKFLESPVSFLQKIKIKEPGVPIRGAISFMACNDKTCLPPEEVPFKINTQPITALIGNAAADQNNLALEVEASDEAFQSVYGASNLSLEEPLSAECGSQQEIAKASNLSIFVLGFFGGLLALLTPCVFPMIPLTVSFFTKASENKSKGIGKAVWYGVSIFLIYLLLSIPFHIMDSVDGDILNQISTNVWLNLAFFLIFLFFAFSFFGYYEITLPSSWTNKTSSAESFGGALGVFFMALTLALVSFSCTGPILGSLLAGALSSSGGAWQLSYGMGGFGLALALPFSLFAAFPSWMNALPKSGGWLNAVKVVLGFIELGLAFKFLSNADLVEHWGLLKIEPFLIIWIVISLGLAAYLFGLIKFPHDSPLKKISIPRGLLAGLALAFAIYLGFGFKTNKLTGNYEPLTLLSGLAPPVCYSFFNPCDCPQGLNCFKDFNDGITQAQKENKPILLDFTGYACVNCRKMEEHVWPKQQVINHLRDDFVLVSLYVDDKKGLPIDEQKVVNKPSGGTRKLKNYGHKWSNFQEYFGANSQPYYVLLTPEGELLTNPVGYTPDVNEFSSFLKCGLSTYQQITEAN